MKKNKSRKQEAKRTQKYIHLLELTKDLTDEEAEQVRNYVLTLKNQRTR